MRIKFTLSMRYAISSCSSTIKKRVRVFAKYVIVIVSLVIPIRDCF